jgi:hypothetical protein
MLREICLDHGAGLAMLAAGKAFAGQRHWQVDPKVPQTGRGVASPGVKPISTNGAGWLIVSGEGGASLSIWVAGKDEFPNLDYDSCTFSFDGARNVAFADEIRSQFGLGESTTLGGQKDIQSWLLDGKTVAPFTREGFIEGYRLLGVSLTRVFVPNEADKESPQNQARSVDEATQTHPGSHMLPHAIQHDSKIVTVVAVMHHHIPQDVMDQAGNRLMLLFP